MAKEIATSARTDTPKEFKGVSRKIHIDADGKEGRSAVAGETGLRFEFKDGRKFTVTRKDFTNEVWDAAAWHGMAQKLGDSYADCKKSGEDPYDEADKMLEQLKVGNWIVGARSTGPRIGLLVEAIVAAKTKAGLKFDESAIAEKMKDKDAAKSARANAAVDVEYKRIERERAAEREEAAQTKAKAAGGAGLDTI